MPAASTAVMSDMMIKQITGLRTASNYQMDVFRHIAAQAQAIGKRKEAVSVVVKAVAGSGKTTTAVAANSLVLQQIATPNAKILFLAFNASIKNELAARLPSGVIAKTLNGHGFGILAQFVRTSLNVSRMGDPDGRKTWKIMRNLRTPEEVKRLGADVSFIVSKCKAFGVIPPDMDSDLFAPLNDQYATDETLMGICKHFQRRIDPTNEVAIFNLVREVLASTLLEMFSGNSRTAPTFDFDDQKYIPVVVRPNGRPLAMAKYDVIFLDEAQDVNPVDLELVRLSLKKGGMVVAIGDDRQAIYGFRGADVDSINNIKSTFGAIELPLSITYRCSKKIVEAASEVYPEIEAAPNAADGEVVHLDKYDASLFRPSDMIICRNNAPLVAMAYRLIRARVAVHMMGRDFGKDLLTLIDHLTAYTNKNTDSRGPERAVTSVRKMAELLDHWEERQIAMIRDKDGDDSEIDRVADRAATIRVFIQDNHDDRVESVIEQITALFGTNQTGAERVPADKVILSSGHRSKGLEADRVFFLDSHLLYPEWVFEGTWQEVQEKNLHYVILTRAKSYLGFIDSRQMV